MAAALLCFNFNYGDFVCWLGGEYTGAQRDWDATFDIVDSVRTSSIPPGYPAINFDRAVQLATEGVPLAGHRVQLRRRQATRAPRQRLPYSRSNRTRTKKVYQRGKALLPHSFP